MDTVLSVCVCVCVCVCVDYELVTYDSSFDISYEWKRKM